MNINEPSVKIAIKSTSPDLEKLIDADILEAVGDSIMTYDSIVNLQLSKDIKSLTEALKLKGADL